MTKRRKRVWIAASVVLMMTLGIVTYRFSGSTAVESWVGSQLLEIGGDYLEPTLRFENLTYVRPRTIVVDNLTLSSPDPSNPGRSVVILAVKRARLELTEIPRRGQPIKFSEITLESPEIHAIAAAPGGASLVGFSNLLKQQVDPHPAGGTTTAVIDPSSPRMKISDFLLVRHIAIKNGSIHYDSRLPDSPPLLLDGVNAELNFSPTDSSGTPGLYALNTDISRGAAFQLALQGKLDIDTLTLALTKLDLTLDLQEKNARMLPPELQTLLRRFEVTGSLHATAGGTLPLGDWRQGSLATTGQLTGAHVAAGENHLAIDTWTWDARMAGGILTIQKTDVRLLGGQVYLQDTVPLSSTQPAHLEAGADNVQLQQLLRSTGPDGLPRYAGNLSARISYAAPMAHWNTQAQGGGTMSIRQGRIAEIPVLGKILTSLSQVLTLSPINKQGLKDAADGRFSFAGDHLRVDEFSGTSGLMAFRGTGTVGFDQQLELRFNGGPLEGLQNSLGDLGKMWASMSDAVAGYRVTGSLRAPNVSMEVGKGR